LLNGTSLACNHCRFDFNSEKKYYFNEKTPDEILNLNKPVELLQLISASFSEANPNENIASV